MNRILLVGNGAREHVIAESLTKDDQVELYAFMNRINPGIADLSKNYRLGDLDNNADIVKYAKDQHIDYAIIGPEDPLSRGLVDDLEKNEIHCASPDKEMSKIEWSKAFARTLMQEHHISGCPFFQIFSHKDDSESIKNDLMKILKDFNNEVAVKPDYLTGGKGVRVWGDHFNSPSEVLDYVNDLLKKGSNKVLIEEKIQKHRDLQNSEFTIQAFISKSHVIPLPLVQDFKRAYNGDKGPNTGSMGSYSCLNHSLPFLNENHYKEGVNILEDTARVLKYYKGVLYGQFMITADFDVKLIEFNSRFGDPEALNVLPLLKGSFNSACEEIIDGNMKKKEWDKKATVCVYLTPKGYPQNPIENSEIKINNNTKFSRIYYASVNQGRNKTVFTTRSRALGVLGIGNSVKEAKSIAYSSIKSISGDLHYRTDIAEGI